MKAKRVLLLFKDYLDSLLVRPKLEDGEAFAVVYGTDEFKIVKRSKSVLVGGVGLVESPGVESLKFKPEWLAIVESNGVSNLIFGMGNPFRTDHPSIPKKDGVVVAVPACIGDVPTSIA